MLISILGFCEFWDILFPESTPKISYIGRSEEAVYARLNSSKVMPDSPDDCWQACQKPLLILKKVCPEAANWVVERFSSDKITWRKEGNGCNANYDYISKKLIINRDFFEQRDGDKAVTLAHEYFHSLQNNTKLVRSVIACLIKSKPQEKIVENEAYLFQYEVWMAIFD